MICPNCGKEYNEKMTCCISCGADLVPLESETEEIAAAENMQPAQDEETIIPIVPEIVSVEPATAKSLEDNNAAAPLKHSRKAISTLSGAARLTGSLITAALMFLMILTSVAASGIRLLTDKDKITEFTDKIDVMALPATQFSKESSDTVQDAVLAMSQGTGLTRNDIRTIYEQSTAKDFLAAQLTGYAEYIRSGTPPEKLTAEQLKKVFAENVPLIDSTMGYPLNDSDIALACSEIDKAEPLLDMLSTENLEQTIGEKNLIAIRILSSVPTIVFTAALAASMLIVFYALNKRSAVTLSWGGGTILAGGAAVLAATFLFSAQLPYGSKDRLFRTILKCTCDVISPDLYRVGAILAIAGIVMLIWAESLRRNKTAN